MQTEVGPVRIERDGVVQESETTLVAGVPNVVLATTSLPRLGTQITTTYVGADDTTTVAVDLVVGPRPEAGTQTRDIAREFVPVTHARSQCLLDHASEVMRVLRARAAGRWTVDVTDEATERADAV